MLGQNAKAETEVVPWDSQYVPLVMQDFCAAPCCISIVMLRRRLALVPQELLAYHLGLAIPKDKLSARFFNPRMIAAGSEGGLQSHEPSFHPSLALAALGIPLHFQFVPVSGLEASQLRALLLELTSDDNRDVLFHFDRSVLDSASPAQAGRNRPVANEPASGRTQRQHMCVLDKLIIPESESESDSYRMRILDPAVDAPKWRVVEAARLLLAMQVLGEESLGGVWLLYCRSFSDNDSSDDHDSSPSPPTTAPPYSTPAITPALSAAMTPALTPRRISPAARSTTLGEVTRSASDDGGAWLQVGGGVGAAGRNSQKSALWLFCTGTILKGCLLRMSHRYGRRQTLL